MNKICMSKGKFLDECEKSYLPDDLKEEMKNLIVAGRCTSVNETLWDVMRVIPCCAVTGQAAGTAAAMTDDFSTIDILALQKKLQDNGVVLHENDLIK